MVCYLLKVLQSVRFFDFLRRLSCICDGSGLFSKWAFFMVGESNSQLKSHAFFHQTYPILTRQAFVRWGALGANRGHMGRCLSHWTYTMGSKSTIKHDAMFKYTFEQNMHINIQANRSKCKHTNRTNKSWFVHAGGFSLMVYPPLPSPFCTHL